MWGDKTEIFGKPTESDSATPVTVFARPEVLPLWAHVAIGIYVAGLALGFTWLLLGVGLLRAITGG